MENTNVNQQKGQEALNPQAGGQPQPTPPKPVDPQMAGKQEVEHLAEGSEISMDADEKRAVEGEESIGVDHSGVGDETKETKH